MTRQTFNFLLSCVHEHLIKKISNRNIVNAGRYTIAPEKQLLLSLWVFSTPNSYRSVCDRFNVGRAIAIRSVRRVTNALLRIRQQFIKWPEPHETPNIHRAFQALAGFPNVIGAVDGIHIKIQAPRNHPEAYINRKNFHSVQLQVVCDHTKRFLHCCVGQPGSVHDQRVFHHYQKYVIIMKCFLKILTSLEMQHMRSNNIY